ncbi:hypothetical protein PMAYCL1PPCAC_08811, partial [Pristionchus mayeri]
SDAYWQCYHKEAQVLLRSIAMTATVSYVCCQADFAKTEDPLMKVLREIECRSMSLVHAKPISNRDRCFSSSESFFPGVQRLILKGIRMEPKQYATFYEWVKSSRLQEVQWALPSRESEMKEFDMFAYRVMGVRRHARNRLTTCKANYEV